jgi:NAD(P) transhydrogenase
VKRQITLEDLAFRCEHVIRSEVEIIRDQMARNGVDLIFGEASFVDPHCLRVTSPQEEEEHSAPFIVIATGTLPARPPEVPFDAETIVDADGLIRLRRIPKSVTIVGGGVIGCEYATILAALEIKATLVERRPCLLEFVDPEILESLQYHMREIGISLRLGEEVSSVERRDGRVVARLKSGKEVTSEVLFYAVGRVGATKELNLPASGVEADERERIRVNASFQTSVPHIYAVGDVIGFPSLASTSMEQGRLASCHAFGVPADHFPELLPYGIYTIPEISMVGRNEAELTRAKVPYEVGLARYREIARGQLIGDEVGLLKILFHRETRELLGVHAIGEGATELIHIGQAVLAFRGKLDYFLQAVFNYPTLAECYKVAALDGMNRLARL